MRAPILLSAAVALMLGGCATSTGPAATSPSSTTVSESPSAVPVNVDKLLIVVLENHSLDQVLSSMPYVASLATDYAYATHYTATRHPSLPNYLAIAGGSTFGVTDDVGPGGHRIRGTSIFGQALAAGRTAAVYAEGMTANCQTSNQGHYAVRHNPWAYFVDERDLCKQFDVPFDQLAGDVAAGALPSVGMVIPDVCNDAHDCTLATADAWYQGVLPSVLAGPDFQSGRLVVVLTADEDDRKHANKVLTVVLQQGGVKGVVTAPLTHYSLSRLCSEIVGAPALRKGLTAQSMSDAFLISVSRALSRVGQLARGGT